MQLLLQVYDYMPETLILSPSFPPIFQTILTALTLVQVDINYPALDLLRRILAHDSLINPPGTPSAGQSNQNTMFATAIRQSMAEQGFQLVGLVLTGLVTYFVEDTNSLVITIFRILADLWPNELATWLPPVLEQIPTATLSLPAKSQFLSDFGRYVMAFAYGCHLD